MKKLRTASIQKMHAYNALLNTVIVTVLCLLIGYYLFALERTQLLQENRLSSLNVSNSYRNKYENMWRVYYPVVGKSSFTDAFSSFIAECPGRLSATTRMNLSNTLKTMLYTDADIAGFVLHAYTDGGIDYLYDGNTRQLTALEEGSPLYGIFDEEAPSRKITGSQTIQLGDKQELVYGISGLFPGTDMQSGSLMVLYRTSHLMSAYHETECRISPIILVVSDQGDVIFDSLGRQYGTSIDIGPYFNYLGEMIDHQGRRYYMESISGTRAKYVALCFTPNDQVFRMANRNTPAVILLGALINLTAIFFHLYTGYLTTRRVRVLLQGIDRIGQHELDFRFAVTGNNDDFEKIALGINQMAVDMQKNIEQTYLYSLREKAAEMGELQAKFNPHFLYNTLEVIRSHLHQKQDDETADMIVLLARIFRSAINSDHFTTLRNECLFINSYLDIYRWRYQNCFEVIYDMDTSILECGIIRNLLQPLIENYFVHGFSAERENNRLIIGGEKDGDSYLSLTVEDNGLGIPPGKLIEIQEKLNAHDNRVTAADSYGLQNLHDRIRLFYGSDCGLSIISQPHDMTVIKMRIRRMSLSEHESWIRRH